MENKIETIGKEKLNEIVSEIFENKQTSIYIKEKYVYVWFDGFYLKIRENILNPRILNCDAIGKISLINMNKTMRLMNVLNKM